MRCDMCGNVAIKFYDWAKDIKYLPIITATCYNHKYLDIYDEYTITEEEFIILQIFNS